jgi:hypothetical protein
VRMRNTVISLIALLGTVSANAEQADSRAILPKPVLPPPQKLIIRAEDLFPLTPPKRLGMFTLVPPETNGEVIRVAIPVGDLASRAARAISDTRRRRTERKVDERIARELRQLDIPDGVSEKRQ